MTGWLPDLAVVPTLAVVRNASFITDDFVGSLPTEYVVKGGHGSAMVMLVRADRARAVTCGSPERRAGLECQSTSRREHARFIAGHCARWLRTDYGRKFGEVGYSHVEPSCVFERSLLDDKGGSPRDVKVLVSHGEPLLLMDVVSRFGLHARSGRTRHVLVDTSGKALAGAYGGSADSLAEFADACADIGGGGAPGGLVPAYPPGQFETLLRYSRVLAAHAARESAGVPFAQIRVDFFVLGPAVYFAELTLYTQACFTKWTPPALDMLLGHIASTPTTAVSPGCLAKAVAAECPASQGGGKTHAAPPAKAGGGKTHARLPGASRGGRGHTNEQRQCHERTHSVHKNSCTACLERKEGTCTYCRAVGYDCHCHCPPRTAKLLNVLAYSSNRKLSRLECWLGWMQSMMRHDRDNAYSVTIKNEVEYGGQREKVLLLLSEVHKQRWVARTERRPAEPLLFVDIDVVPLQPFSSLLPELNHSDIVFMHEPRGSRSGLLNAGFILLRPTQRVEEFLHDWHVRMISRSTVTGDLMGDQLVANQMLWGWKARSRVSDVAGSSLDRSRVTSARPNLRWDLLDERLVVGIDPKRVKRGTTIAYHAVGPGSKTVKMNSAIRRGAMMPLQPCWDEAPDGHKLAPPPPPPPGQGNPPT